jgi:hypothetical protein
MSLFSPLFRLQSFADYRKRCPIKDLSAKLRVVYQDFSGGATVW